MFVENCIVKKDETLVLASKKGKGREGDERYRPVVCASCEAEVGVQDEEEVYHFFNVIPGL